MIARKKFLKLGTNKNPSNIIIKNNNIATESLSLQADLEMATQHKQKITTKNIINSKLIPKLKIFKLIIQISIIPHTL